ncbi:hypothetical protein KY338_01110 [Candidatus Woesearchaeota archaeon]|nr:hypothetical protein [Candidatus Woesearchaeota archaeon]MBW3006007.1 hypothetical protein [Candidatus Woesearchaeota archaeon]
MSKEQNRKGIISRRNLLKISCGMLATATIGSAFWFGRPRTLTNCKNLGELPVRYRSGEGRPIIFLANRHPVSRWGSDIHVSKKNIDILSKAAIDAYDRYGVRSILIEGFYEEFAHAYNSNKKIEIEGNFADTPQLKHELAIVTLLNARTWTSIGDAGKEYRQLKSVLLPVEQAYKIYYKAFIDAIDQANSNPAKNRKELEAQRRQLESLRAKLQEKINIVVSPHIDTIVEHMFIRRENVVYSRAKDVLQKEPLVVLYGSNHARGIKQRAEAENAGYMLVTNLGRDYVLHKHSLEELVVGEYSLPELGRSF